MARIRSVHPDICLDEVLCEVSARAERTFVRLWTHLDDAGRCVDNPKLIKAALYPLHDDMTAAEVDTDLWELIAHGLLLRYEADGKKVLAAKPTSWGERQRPKHPTPSKLPDVPDDYTPPEPPGKAYPSPTVGRGEDMTNGASDARSGIDDAESHEQSSSTPGLPQSYPGSGEDFPGSLHGVVEGVGDGEGVGVSRAAHPGRSLAIVPSNSSSPTAKKTQGYPDDFELWWQGYPRKIAKADAAKAWKRARRSTDADTLTTALAASVRAWRAQGRATEHIPHAASWLNGRRWEDQPDTDMPRAPEPKGFAGIRAAFGIDGAS